MVGMFIIGFIIFGLYMFGLLYAIKWGHNSQRQEMMNDPELKGYYNRHSNWDKDIVYDTNAYLKSRNKSKKKRKFKQVTKK